MAYFRKTPQGQILEVHLQPNARKDSIIGLYGDRLKITITASPIDGKANKHLLKFLAKHFGVTQKQVKIIRGENSRDKTILIENN